MLSTLGLNAANPVRCCACCALQCLLSPLSCCAASLGCMLAALAARRAGALALRLLPHLPGGPGAAPSWLLSLQVCVMTQDTARNFLAGSSTKVGAARARRAAARAGLRAEGTAGRLPMPGRRNAHARRSPFLPTPPSTPSHPPNCPTPSQLSDHEKFELYMEGICLPMPPIHFTNTLLLIHFTSTLRLPSCALTERPREV